MTKPQTSTLAQLRTPQPAESQMPAVRAGFFDLQSFELMQRVAKGFAASTLVPQTYQGNLANCMIALNLAQRINGDPLMVMQNLVIVHGKPTWSAQYLIATANMCERFSAIRFEFFGEKNTDTWGCRAWAIEKATGEKLIGADINIAIAKKEGWYSKNGSKWQSIPQQMLMYRAGSWWVRAYAPELSMGLMTADEAHDAFDAKAGDDGTFSVDLGALRGTEQPDVNGTVIDGETGEITGQNTDAATPETTADAYTEERAAIAECQSMTDLIKLMNSMSAKAKKALHGELTARQAALKPAVVQMTYAVLAERLQKAADIDILDADADLIKELPEDQQADLSAIYHRKRAELEG